MKEDDKFSNELNYYASFPKAFTVDVIVDFSAEPLNPSLIGKCLLEDSRFIVIQKRDNSELFISKAVLRNWLIYLNVHLAKSKVSHLSKKHFNYSLLSLFDSNDCDEAIEIVTTFGEGIALISFSDYSQDYVFPIAHILSFVNERRQVLFGLLSNAIENSGIPFERHADEILEKTLLEFDSRDLFVFKAREGLLGEQKRTLSEIADILELTRERIRQLQRSIYKRKIIYRPFLTALIQDIVHRKGSVLFNTAFIDADIRKLFAKCLGIPVTVIIGMKLVAMGVSKDSLDIQNPSLEVESTIKVLIAKNEFCLADGDLCFLAASVITYWKENAMLIDRVYATLKHIGEPSHYSKVCKVISDNYSYRPATIRISG